MFKSNGFLVLVVSYLFGILVCEFLMEEEFVRVIVVFSMWVMAVRWMARLWDVGIFRIFVFGIVFLIFGVMRFFFSFEGGEGHVANFEGYVEIEGCVVEEVDVRKDKVKYVVEASRLFFEGERVDVHGKVLVSASRYPVYEYGDCFLVKGDLQRPDKIDDFSYDKYLSRYSIYSIIYYAQIEKISGDGGGEFYSWIYKFKQVFEGRLNEIFAEPESSFMAGLILGTRRGISEELMQEFNLTGLTHIIAISGYNVTLVIVIVSGMFGFLSRRWKVVFSIVFVVLFVILVGASAAVVRAGIMGVISLCALWFGREYAVVIALFASAFFMNLWNPKILVYDVGFQLSFLATFGIIVFSPLMEKWIKWVPDVLGMREAVMLTLSAQVFALPIIVFNFGRLSLISPVANLFVLPFIPLAMICGFFAVGLSAISGFLGSVVGFLGYLILNLIILFVGVFASLEFASLDIEWMSWWLVVLYYLFLMKILKPHISKFC